MASSKVRYSLLPSEDSTSFLQDDPDPTTSATMSSGLADNDSVKANAEVREDIEASSTSKDQATERIEVTEEDVRTINPILRQ